MTTQPQYITRNGAADDFATPMTQLSSSSRGYIAPALLKGRDVTMRDVAQSVPLHLAQTHGQSLSRNTVFPFTAMTITPTTSFSNVQGHTPQNSVMDVVRPQTTLPSAPSPLTTTRTSNDMQAPLRRETALAAAVPDPTAPEREIHMMGGDGAPATVVRAPMLSSEPRAGIAKGSSTNVLNTAAIDGLNRTQVYHKFICILQPET